ncbi:MAG: hypothetical protein AAGF11_16140 [Myxococcota bacterium]
MRVGIICEGSTDFPVLREIVAQILHTRHPTFSLLQPDFDALSRPPGIRKPATGWQAVRSFLQSGAVAMSTLDLVVVQVDASIRRLVSVARQVDSDELDDLCDHVKGWMGEAVPDAVVITLPREEIETWLLAAHTRVKTAEVLKDPATALLDHGLLDARTGKKRGVRVPDKRSRRYEELARPLRSKVTDARWLKTVPELARFVDKLRAHQRRR